MITARDPSAEERAKIVRKIVRSIRGMAINCVVLAVAFAVTGFIELRRTPGDRFAIAQLAIAAGAVFAALRAWLIAKKFAHQASGSI